MNYELRSGVEIKVLKTMPKGWKETKGAMTAPRGTIMVDNGGSLFGKGGKRRESALVIVDEELFKESLKEKSGRKAKENQGLNKTVKPTVSPPAKKRAGVPKPPKVKTYTVAGRTFATRAEAQTFKALRKRNASKPCEIMEGTRKPTHKIVSFTAKNK